MKNYYQLVYMHFSVGAFHVYVGLALNTGKLSYLRKADVFKGLR